MMLMASKCGESGVVADILSRGSEADLSFLRRMIWGFHVEKSGL